MMPDRRTALSLLLAGAGAAASAARMPAWAPVRGITLMVPLPPGGATDRVARIVGDGLGRRLGQPVTVGNRLGAGGTLAAEAVARAAPDGHALVMTGLSALAAGPMTRPEARHDPCRDLAQVALLARAGLVLLAAPGLRESRVRDVVARLHARPGSLAFALTRPGLSEHLALTLLQQVADVELRVVHHRGEAPALADLAAGRADLLYTNAAVAAPQVRAGRLRALAVTGTERSTLLPEVPTLAESGLRCATVDAWVGLAGPAGLSAEVADRLNRECAAVLAEPETRQRLAALGLRPMEGTPQQATTFVQAESERWSRVVRAGNIRAA